ncbi:MAG: S1C family serine protease [Spirochaetales bacterium]
MSQKRTRTTLRIAPIVIGIVLVAGCVSTGPEPPPPERAMDEQRYLSEGRELLEGPTTAPFLFHLSTHASEYPDAASALLETFAEREQSIVEDLVIAGDAFAALDRLGSLDAVSGLTETRQELERRIASLLLEQGHRAAGETLFSDQQPRSQPSIPEAQAIEEYRRVLGEVHVRNYYENPDGVVRFTPDTFAGTGFLVSDQHMLTAYHVVEQVQWPDTIRYEIEVLVDGTWVEADLLSWDSILDLAILELAEPQSPRFSGIERLSARGELEFGEAVITLGHHSGLTETLTRGVVSAPRRRAPELGDWIQIDAAVTGGASGGMLIGQDGLIQGLLVAGLIGEDLNFAVPSPAIRGVIDRLLSGTSIRKPWLGMSLLPERLGESESVGVAIRDIFPSSPLAAYDLDGGKVIEINHQPVNTVVEAQAVLARTAPGNAVHIAVQEGTAERDYWVTALARPDFAMYNGHGTFDRIKTLYPFFGFSVDANLPEAEITYTEREGVAVLLYPVTEVDPESFISSRGVDRGDRIGIITDEFFGMTRVVRVLHIPRGKTLDSLHRISDYIYTIERGRYDQNIL